MHTARLSDLSSHAPAPILNRHTLRKGDGGGKVAALLAFPDEGGGSGQGQDGMVVWAADQAIHMNLPSSKVCQISEGVSQLSSSTTKTVLFAYASLLVNTCAVLCLKVSITVVLTCVLTGCLLR